MVAMFVFIKDIKCHLKYLVRFFQVIKNRLSTPYTDGCIESSDYSQSKCLQDCVIRVVYNCGSCIMNPSPSGCNMLDGFNCGLRTALPKCNCKPKCHDELYEYTATSAAFPNTYAFANRNASGLGSVNATDIEAK